MKAVSGIALLVYVLLCAAADWKERRISLNGSILAGMLGLVSCFLMGRPLPELGKALIPGLVIGLTSVTCRGCIGKGDAVFALVCGMYLCWQNVAAAIAVSWAVCSLLSLVMIAVGLFQKPFSGRKGLPFITVMSIPLSILITQNYLGIDPLLFIGG